MSGVPARNRRLILQRIGLSVVAALTIVTVAEWLSRCRVLATDDAASTTFGLIGSLVQPSADAGLLYELRPNLRTEWRGVIVATDAQGDSRISTLRAPHPSAAIKIALLGDSTPFGWGCFMDCTYGTVLQDILEDRLHCAVEIRNFAVPGYNTSQELACLRHKALPWQPDIVILHYDHNDPEPCDTIGPDYLPPTSRGEPLHSKFLELLWRRWRQLHHRWLNRSQSVAASDKLDLGGGYSCVFRGSIYNAHLADLRAFASLCAAAGIPVVTVVWECHLQASPTPRATPYYQLVVAPLLADMQRAGMYTCALFDYFHSLMQANRWPDLHPLWQSETDTHPTPLGHDLIARWVADFLVATPALYTQLTERAAARPFTPPPPDAKPARDFCDGVLAFEGGDLAQARSSLEAACAKAPHDAGIRLALSACLLEENLPDESIAQLEQLLAVHSNSVAARLALGQAYLHKGDVPHARRHIRDAVRLAPDAVTREGALLWLRQLDP